MSVDVRIITPWYGNFAGGAEVAARRYAEELAARGLSVQLWATACRSPFDNWWENHLPVGEERIGEVTVRRFPVNSEGRGDYERLLGRRLRGETLELEEYRLLARNSCNSAALIESAVDEPAWLTLALPYTQGLTYSSALALTDALTLMPCFHEEDQLHWPTTGEMLSAVGRCAFLSHVEKRTTIRAHGLSTGRRLVESPVVGLGVDAPPAPGDKAPVDGPYLVYVGRKDPGKGLLQLLDWMHLLWKDRPSLKLVLVGGGNGVTLPDDPRIVDLGFVSAQEKATAIHHALALVNLSTLESFSIVLFEAWLLGVPVVVNSAGEVTMSFVRASGGGVGVRDAEGLSEAMSLLEDPRERALRGEAGRTYARVETSWDVVVNRFLQGVKR